MNRRKKILKIGLAMEVQKIEKIPTDKYDQNLDYIVTNKSWKEMVDNVGVVVYDIQLHKIIKLCRRRRMNSTECNIIHLSSTQFVDRGWIYDM